MTNFNSINNTNIFNNISFSQIQKTPVQNQNSESSSLVSQNFSQINAQKYSPAAIFDYSLFQMNNQEIMKFLQSMMDMPKTFNKFIALAKTTDDQALKLIIENLVDTRTLAEFLNKNSKVAVQKVLNILSEAFRVTSTENGQLRELVAILNSISQNTSSQTNNALRELLLLYVPINPEAFSRNVDFELDESQEKEVKNSKLSIIFESKNFSNVLFCLKGENNQFDFNIFANELFPIGNFAKIIQKYINELNLKMFVDFNKTGLKSKSEFQNFKIFSDGLIPLNLLLFSHIAIKIFFEMDNNFISD